MSNYPQIRVGEIYEVLDRWNHTTASNAAISHYVPAFVPGAKFEVLEVNDRNGITVGVTMIKDIETKAVYTIDIDIFGMWCFFNSYDILNENLRLIGDKLPPMELRLTAAIAKNNEKLTKLVTSSLESKSRDEIQQALNVAQSLRQNLGHLENYLVTNLSTSK
ncbi:hypothetical protein Henu6_gp46 [Acinetobacter phage Henu6]|uniref:Uncharacterized protein n=1 Tax=Acinetobacter phage Henu6 TaxID=2500136 RepID=A0A410T5P4_9CAUD|nr:hypothetical protein Henu6_gp46 [Acinetobacter phage Henu6]